MARAGWGHACSCVEMRFGPRENRKKQLHSPQKGLVPEQCEAPGQAGGAAKGRVEGRNGTKGSEMGGPWPGQVLAAAVKKLLWDTHVPNPHA